MRENSRRAKAIAQLNIAEDAIAKAIQHLGGYTRSFAPKRNPSTFVSRKMIESCALRLHAAVNLLNYGERPTPPTKEQDATPVDEVPASEVQENNESESSGESPRQVHQW